MPYKPPTRNKPIIGGCCVWLSIFLTLLSILLGILNYSPDDSIIYRLMFDSELLNNKDNFYFGCFCVQNQLDGSLIQVGNDEFCNSNGCTSEMIVLNSKFYKDLILLGDVGIGESYFNEYWTYNSLKYDLANIISEFIVGITNDTASSSISLFTGKYIKYFIIEQWLQWYERVYGITKSINEDKNNIMSHYDAGNDLYESFLDDTMVYTCAFWNKPTDTLSQAQKNKIDLLMNKMDININDNVIDMGNGWGYATSRIHEITGANITGITISEQQFKYSVDKYGQETLNTTNKNRYRRYMLQDYRDTDTLSNLMINKVISIGMLEHVGIKNIGTFFESISNLFDATMKIELDLNLNKKGNKYILGLHYITSADITPGKIDIRLQTACQQQTFIWKYIFPGGCLIAPDWTIQVARNYGFQLVHQEFFGLHYAKTLNIWRKNWKNGFNKFIEKNKNKYKDNKMNKKLYLLYEIYFAFCEAMFRSHHITLVQQVFIMPNMYYNRNISIRNMYTDFNLIKDEIYIPKRV